MKLNQPYYIEPRNGDSHLNLNGTWDFAWEDNKISDISTINYEHSGELPNSIYHLLANENILPPPYVGTNSKKYNWVDEKIWYFRKKVKLNKPNYAEKVFLCFDGVAYYCRLWVNGNLLGDHEGMMGGPTCEISKYLNFTGNNEFVVEVTANTYGIKEGFSALNRQGTNSCILPWNITRDNETSTGDFIVVGLWNKIRLEFVNNMHISRPYLYTENIESDKATLQLELEFTDGSIEELKKYYAYGSDVISYLYTRAYDNGLTGAVLNNSVEISVVISENDTKKIVYSNTDNINPIDYEKSCIDNRWYELQFYNKTITIDNPKLWYPNGLGDAYLYDVELVMSYDGKECDRHSFKTGIRTFTSAKTAGPKYRQRWNNFRFYINGKDFFLQGMNWQPTDFLYKIDEDKYRWLLTLAKNSGIQLIRVWSGGGRYEDDIFYNLCDELGLMVWQDSMMANMYDTHCYNQEILESQIAYNLYRIRNHASLVIHCGGNEFNPYSEKNAASMFIVDRIIRQLDRNKIFHYTTADMGSAHIYRDMEPVWYSKLYAHMPFVGESGIHSFPTYKALKKLICKNEYERPLPNLSSPEFAENFPELVNHFTEYNPTRIPRMTSRISQIDNLNGITLERMCEASQVQAYEFYMIMIQSFRNNYPYCGGIMPWVFNRPFTTVGIQLIDGEGNPGYEYYAVKNTYRNTDVMLKLDWTVTSPGEKIPLNLRILGDAPKKGTISVVVYTPKLEVQKEYRADIESSVCEYSFDDFIPDDTYTNECFLICAEICCENGESVRNTYFIKCTDKLNDKDLYQKYRSSVQNNLEFENGPWLRRDIESANKAKINASIINKCIKNGYLCYDVKLKNISDTAAYPVIIDAEQFNCFATDNFFLLKSAEEKVVALTLNTPEDTTASILIKWWNAENEIKLNF